MDRRDDPNLSLRDQSPEEREARSKVGALDIASANGDWQGLAPGRFRDLLLAPDGDNPPTEG